LLEALKNMTKPDAVVLTEQVLPQAPETLSRLENGGTILEIGPGGGFALAHYATRFPSARLVGVEFDGPSVELARQTMQEARVADRVEIRHADANLLDEEDTYDLVVMNITLHETGGPPEYLNVLQRSRRALTPSGSILVSELPYPDSPTAYRENPIYQALAGVQIHEAQVGCGAITQNELRGLLSDAGFRNLRVAEQPLPTRFMMLAEK
jgi:ubiquinone/menaquinone biosynthesis C-methylase UbiE